jgi:hypothetical protein
MNSVSYFKTTKDAIKSENETLNTLMRDYDRWASRNPNKIVSSKKKGDENFEKGKDFREFRQKIKLCKLRIKELEELERLYQNTPKRLDN